MITAERLDALALTIVRRAADDVLDVRTDLTAILQREVAPLPHDALVLLVQRIAYRAGTLAATHTTEVRRALLGHTEGA